MNDDFNHAGLLRFIEKAGDGGTGNAGDFADILLAEILLIIKLGDSYEQIGTAAHNRPP
jgi:hypothetical protein